MELHVLGMRVDHWWAEHHTFVREWWACSIAALLGCVVLTRCYDHWTTTWQQRTRSLLCQLGRQVPSLSVVWDEIEEDGGSPEGGRGSHVLIWLDFDPNQDAVALDTLRALPRSVSLRSMAFDGTHRRLCLRLPKRQSMRSILWTSAVTAAAVGLLVLHHVD